MAKENKTTLELYKSFKHRKFACLLGKWISIISPFVVIGIVNFNEYFVQYDGVKMSLGCILAAFVAGFAIFNEVKETNKKTANVVKWAIAFGLVYFFSAILQDLVLIVGCGTAGQVVGTGFKLGYENYNDKIDIMSKAITNAKANSEAYERMI